LKKTNKEGFIRKNLKAFIAWDRNHQGKGDDNVLAKHKHVYCIVFCEMKIPLLKVKVWRKKEFWWEWFAFFYFFSTAWGPNGRRRTNGPKVYAEMEKDKGKD